jgi:hypothetical protein
MSDNQQRYKYGRYLAEPTIANPIGTLISAGLGFSYRSHLSDTATTSPVPFAATATASFLPGHGGEIERWRDVSCFRVNSGPGPGTRKWMGIGNIGGVGHPVAIR